MPDPPVSTVLSVLAPLFIVANVANRGSALTVFADVQVAGLVSRVPCAALVTRGALALPRNLVLPLSIGADDLSVVLGLALLAALGIGIHAAVLLRMRSTAAAPTAASLLDPEVGHRAYFPAVSMGWFFFLLPGLTAALGEQFAAPERTGPRIGIGFTLAAMVLGGLMALAKIRHDHFSGIAPEGGVLRPSSVVPYANLRQWIAMLTKYETLASTCKGMDVSVNPAALAMAALAVDVRKGIRFVTALPEAVRWDGVVPRAYVSDSPPDYVQSRFSPLVVPFATEGNGYLIFAALLRSLLVGAASAYRATTTLGCGVQHGALTIVNFVYLVAVYLLWDPRVPAQRLFVVASCFLVCILTLCGSTGTLVHLVEPLCAALAVVWGVGSGVDVFLLVLELRILRPTEDALRGLSKELAAERVARRREYRYKLKNRAVAEADDAAERAAAASEVSTATDDSDETHGLLTRDQRLQQRSGYAHATPQAFTASARSGSVPLRNCADYVPPKPVGYRRAKLEHDRRLQNALAVSRERAAWDRIMARGVSVRSASRRSGTEAYSEYDDAGYGPDGGEWVGADVDAHSPYRQYRGSGDQW